MIKDLFMSFSDNFKEKTKNPFLGTYLLVWLIRNWELIYMLFNFDSKTKLADKIAFIEDYYSKVDFVDNVFENIYWSFGLLILTYLLLNISRFIVNLSEKRITPWIYKITDSKSIVLKEEYERVRADNDDLQVRLDKERESKSRLEARIKGLEEEIVQVAKGASVEMTEVTSKSLSSEIPSNADIIFAKVKKKSMLKDFMSTCRMINQGEYLNNDYNPKDYFIEQGLISFDNSTTNTSKRYHITDLGQEVLTLARIESED